MAKVKITGHASGSGVFTITAPNSNTDRTITLPDASVTLGTDATKLPLAGGTMSGAIVLNSTNLTAGDSTSNANKIRMGASNDLNIHHDGSNSYIEDSGTGALRILGSSIELRNAPSDNELMLKATTDGSVELYHNNNKKIETTASGVAITGGVAIGGTGTANTLDDYEEGTHTTAITMGGGTATLNLKTLAYTKIGRQVHVCGQINISAVSSASGTFKISLPFTCATAEQFFSAGNYRTYGIDSPNDGTQAVIFSERGTAFASLQWSRDNAAPVNESATNGGYFLIGLTYFTA